MVDLFKWWVSSLALIGRWMKGRYLNKLCLSLTLVVGSLGLSLAGARTDTSQAQAPDDHRMTLDWQLTPTPTVPGPRRPFDSSPTRLDPPRPVVGGGVGEPRGGPSPSGVVQVLVELSDPPAARAYALAQSLGLPDAAASVIAQIQIARIDAAQQALLPSLTGPPINATVISRTQRVLNGITVEVDASKLEQIQQLPGVVAVRLLGIGQYDGPVSPITLPPTSPVLDPILPGRAQDMNQ